MTSEEIQHAIERLNVLAEFYVGTPIGGTALEALRTINYLRDQTRSKENEND